MKPLGYLEVFWHFSLRTSEEGVQVAVYGNEREAFDANEYGRDVGPAVPIELSRLLSKSDTSNPRWTQERVPTGDAMRVGTELWNALPQEVRDRIPVGNEQIRLKIYTDVPAVGDLPWEWLTDGSGPPLALRSEVIVVRSVPLRFPVHALSVEPPLRVVVLAPNPKDERSLDADRELRVVLDALEGPDFTFVVADTPSLEELSRLMFSHQPNIVHFIGHGGLTHGEGNLILQDADGRSRWLPAMELGALLPSSVRLLSLSTPFTTHNYQVLGLSHVARSPGSTTLPTAIANQYPIDERAARAFWGRFYPALIERSGNVNEAFQAARLAAADVEPDFSDWASFLLTIRDQTGVSFELRPGIEGIDRREKEVRAQFAAEAANDLAEQFQTLGSGVPEGLQRQYRIEEQRVTELLEDLSER